MRSRLMVLMMLAALAVIAVACGRATQEEIDQALGLAPTSVVTGGNGTPGAGAPAPTGNVALGRTQFSFQCQQCHSPAGTGRGPALAGADSPTIALTDEQIASLIRTGEGHGDVPGVTSVRLSDDQLAGVIAYIRQQEET